MEGGVRREPPGGARLGPEGTVSLGSGGGRGPTPPTWSVGV